MTTAGSGGFLSLLPIYLDHILFPTLADSGFTTEVHHVNGDGEDAGVVYCEMQGRENVDSSRAHLELLRAAYPGSGYSSETGGIMHNLRTSTNNEKVRAYHKEFYRAENLTIIITGQVDPEAAFKSIDSVETRILQKPSLPEFQRPWQTPVQPLDGPKDVKILYPSDEEDSGLVYVSWRGPKSSTEQTTLTACSVLLRYLTNTSISPLQQEFVEIEDPLASGVSYSMMENTESLLYVEFENVPVSKMDEIKPKLLAQLANLSKLDMTRMKTIIEKMILEAYCSLEDAPHDAAAFMIIGDALYGQTEEDFAKRMNVIAEYEFLRDQPEAYWVDLLKKYLLTGHSVVIRAYPSVEEQKRMAKEEADRVAAQREKLGSAGLEAKRVALLNAIEANEGRSAGNDVLTSVPVPSVDDIRFHPWSVHRPGSTGALKFRLEDFPYFTECYDLKTNFIYINVSLDTQFLSQEERLYLPLLLELAMESPIQVGVNLIPYEEVVMALESETVTNTISLGWHSSARYSCGPFSNYVFLTLQVIPEKYEKGVQWVRDILFNTVFTAERIRVCAAKLANDITQAKRMGENILFSLLKCIVYKEDSNVQQTSLVTQQKFLTKILADLEKGSDATIGMLNGIRGKLTVPANLKVHMAADWARLENEKNVLGAWLQYMPKGVAAEGGQGKLAVVPDWMFIEAERKVDGKLGAVLGMGSVESSFLLQSVPSIKDFMHPDLPAVMLFLQYLTQLEGSMWRQIRGKGFAYSYNLQPRPHEGFLVMQFYKASNVVGAYRETKQILETTLNGECLDQTLFESARSSLIFEIIEREKSVGELPGQGILCTMKEVCHDYNRQLVKRIGAVDKDKLIEAGRKYVMPLFSEKARSAVVCHSEKADEIKNGLESMGLPLDVQITVEESILGKGSR